MIMANHFYGIDDTIPGTILGEHDNSRKGVNQALAVVQYWCIMRAEGKEDIRVHSDSYGGLSVAMMIHEDQGYRLIQYGEVEAEAEVADTAC